MIKLYFAKGSPFNIGYGYFWKVSGIVERLIPYGYKALYEIDTSKLDVGEKQRVQFVLRENGTSNTVTGSAYINVRPEAITTDNTASTTTPATESSLTEPRKVYGDLGALIRVNKQSVAKGEEITFSIDPEYIQSESSNAKLTYYWTTAANEAGHESSYTVKTNELTIGDQHVVRVAVYKQVNGETARSQMNGMGLFEVTEHKAVTSTNTEKPTIPTSEFTTRIPTIVKDVETVTIGDKVTFSLDAVYEGTRFYWIFDGNGATAQKSSKANLVVDTSGLSPGKYRVRGTVTSENNKQHQVSMWVDVNAGVIDLLVMNKDTNLPEANLPYTLISDINPLCMYTGNTDSKGEIKITDAPLGAYTIRFDTPDLVIVK